MTDLTSQERERAIARDASGRDDGDLRVLATQLEGLRDRLVDAVEDGITLQRAATELRIKSAAQARVAELETQRDAWHREYEAVRGYRAKEKARLHQATELAESIDGDESFARAFGVLQQIAALAGEDQKPPQREGDYL